MEKALMNGTLHVGFLLQPQFTMMTASLAMEPLSIANWLAQSRLFRWQTISMDGQPVRASNGMLLPVDASIGDARDFDAAFVIAGFDAKRLVDTANATTWLQRLARHGVEIGGIETGSEFLAAAGLLDGVRASVHWDNITGFKERYPDVPVVDTLYTLAPERLTCAGGAAAADMMLAWMRKKIDPAIVERVRQMLLFGSMRSESERQGTGASGCSGGYSDAVGRAVSVMAKNIESPVACKDIALRVGMSRRSLERLFRQETGMSPLQYYRTLRLTRAHQLLQQTDLSVTEIAMATGFGSVEHFSREYKKTFNLQPHKDRHQLINAPVSMLADLACVGEDRRPC